MWISICWLLTHALEMNSHFNYVIMSAMAPQITSFTIVYSTVLFRVRSRKTSKLRVTGLCVGNSPVTSEFPTQIASNVENVSIWWRHHALIVAKLRYFCLFSIGILCQIVTVGYSAVIPGYPVQFSQIKRRDYELKSIFKTICLLHIHVLGCDNNHPVRNHQK